MTDHDARITTEDAATRFYSEGEEYTTPKGFRYRAINRRWVLVARPDGTSVEIPE